MHLYGSKTLLLLTRRGSLRAAEEIMGHKNEMISVWLKREAALTQVLAGDLTLSQVDIDEL